MFNWLGGNEVVLFQASDTDAQRRLSWSILSTTTSCLTSCTTFYSRKCPLSSGRPLEAGRVPKNVENAKYKIHYKTKLLLEKTKLFSHKHYLLF